MSIFDRFAKELIAALAALIIGFSAPSWAEGKSDKKDEDEEEDNGPTLSEMVEDFEKIEGLFTLYRDPESGALQMEISKDQIGKEFIYITQTVDGVPYVSFRHVRGTYGTETIVKLQKHYNQIEFIKQVTGLYFDPENAISRAAQANLVPATIAVASIDAESEDGTKFLIDADAIFLNESLQQVTPSPNPNQPPSQSPRFSLGHLNAEKTRTQEVRNYPENTDVVVRYSYDNEMPVNSGGAEVADARNVFVTLQHSFLEMPEEGFTPRFDDYRVGYFLNRVTDMTSISPTPYRDVINRWRLEKQDPEATLSDPIKPITFWIENTTPEDIRDEVEQGALVWNNAFEKAGFTNAIQVKVQPDDATWDAGDIRYNVLRWVSSNQVGYSGYGPSFSNPRTGEILGADIMLNYTSWTYSNAQEHVLDEGFDANFLGQELDEHAKSCAIGQVMQQNYLFALAAIDTAATDPSVRQTLVNESVRALVAHEVGHTLGLMHNFRGSQMLSPGEIHDAAITTEKGIMSSIMDYEIVNVAPTPDEQGHYFYGNIGPYDHWAIEFGYTPSLSDEIAEEARAATLLARSTEPALAFGNGADNTYFAGNGIDPRIQTYDMSSDAITYAKERIELVNRRVATLKDDYQIEGDTWVNLRQAYNILMIQKRVSATTVSRYIGGVYVERNNRDAEGARQPLTPVPLEEQKRAMKVLSDYIFAPDAYALSPELVSHLQLQRRSFDFYGGTEDPKIHDQVMSIQVRTLQHILHPVTMKRINDSGLYGNEYEVSEMLSDLTDAVFKEDLRGSVNTHRQNLQVHYTHQLMGISFGMGGHDLISQSAADYNLRRIERMMRQARRPDVPTDAHRRRILAMVEIMLYGQSSRG